MIDTSRLTRNERAVLTDAVARYWRQMCSEQRTHPNHARRNEATWRAFECERLLAELDGR